MNRRRVMAAAVGGAALARPAVVAAQASREADTLTRALRHEHVCVFAYDAAIPWLRGHDADLAHRLRAHEAAHAAALARAMADRGWPLPAPPARPGEVEVPAIRAGLEGLAGRDGAVALLVDLEALSQTVHRAAITRLRDPRFIQLAAGILGAEAQHEVAWRAVR